MVCLLYIDVAFFLCSSFVLTKMTSLFLFYVFFSRQNENGIVELVVEMTSMTSCVNLLLEWWCERGVRDGFKKRERERERGRERER